MSKRNKSKNNSNIKSKILRFLFGFLIPYIVINYTIFFLYTEVPHIIIKPQDENTKINNIEFSIDSKLPVIDVSIKYMDTNIPYTKNGKFYYFDATQFDNYQITATAINHLSSTLDFSPLINDITPPIINTQTALIANGTITLNVSDEHSRINYDNIYAKDENNNQLSPTFTDQLTGTIQFSITNINSLTVHVEDINGNSAETIISF